MADEDIIISGGYFIEIHGGPSSRGFYDMESPNSVLGTNGQTIVVVYKNLDMSHNSFHHIIECGRFIVPELADKKVPEFLKDIRKGIEEIVSKTKE